eukprot:TRINITY_DN16163_c0_g1_i1.p1 TRINITY_DN16163_c0_g1~~TRINITY_DN16163_c0_g1_i1.p1  ORF type:complete len:320 (-),score=51.34 TRINITY_DN16163_c0_g1_i1:51-971(-)
MSRCRQCWTRFSIEGGQSTELSRGSSNSLTTATASLESSSPLHVFQPEQAFLVSVDGFQVSKPVMFRLTLRRGDAVWRIRRRFSQVRALHKALLLEPSHVRLQLGTRRESLPNPPPCVTMRSMLYGPMDAQFLEARARDVEKYLQALTALIPHVEACEPLYMFLCYVYLPRWTGDRVLAGGGAPPVQPLAIARLPKAKATRTRPRRRRSAAPPAVAAGGFAPAPPASKEAAVAEAAEPEAQEEETSLSPDCVICQEPLRPRNEDADVRVLPCGHEFHYKCIARWLEQRNTCCLCQSAAVPSAPHLF